jgi:hypothetical protein
MTFQQMLGQILLMSRTSSTKDVELLVLRHEVAMPGRTNSRARAGWADRHPPRRWTAAASSVRTCPAPAALETPAQ